MATLRCEECGYKLYEDEDECPKCGARVEDRPRSKKKSREDDDEDDRPKKKARRDDEYDGEDDRPKKKAPNADFEILDDEDEEDAPPKKKSAPAKKPPSADFEIVVDDEDEPAPTKPVKKAPPPPPPKKEVVEPAPMPAPKPVVKKAPPPPPPVKDDEPAPTPKPMAKKAPPPVEEEEATPKPVVKKAPPPDDVVEEEEEAPKPAKKATQAEDFDEVRPAKKAKGKANYDDLVVPRWTGVFTWTILFGIFGPILLSAGLWLVDNSGVGKTVRMEEGFLGVPKEVTEFREHDGMKLNLGRVLAVVGGSMWVMAMLLFYLWLWRAWKLVPKEYGGMHPFVALLFLWVPLLNIVGVFLVIPGLSKAYKKMLEDLEPRRTPKTGATLGMCALIFAIIPVLGFLTPLLLLAWFDQANFAKNRIEAIQDAARV